MAATTRRERFFGWRVAIGAFVLAVFGWGTGFYGPPVFLSVVHAAHGWPVSLISAAITEHYLIGALVGANLPALHRRFGAGTITKLCALAMAAGLAGWSHVMEPWQLFVACALTGAGWSGMSAAAINAIVAPWFDRRRPAALALAYNGGSIGGIIFSPLWVAAIHSLGFAGATLAISVALVATVWVLSDRLFSKSPEGLGLAPDGDEPGTPSQSLTSPMAVPLPGARLWRDRHFLTLAAGMGLGLAAQIGLVAHLYSLLVPALGRQGAGFAMALVTVMAVGGRTLMGALLRPGGDRRVLAAVGAGVQLLGSLGRVVS
jgi:MFS family permease